MLDKSIDWNFTTCRAIYKKRKKANYTFYIIDYGFPDDVYENKKHILEMRNEGLVKTKYFKTKKEAIKFLNKITK